MPKKIDDIPKECLCFWEKRIVLNRETNGKRTEVEEALHVWISPDCTIHKGIRT